MQSGLLEREDQLVALRSAFAASAEGAGSAVIVDGPAGAGKTSLLHAARHDAVAAGLLCLTARGAELEQAFAYGVLRQLLDGVLRDPADLFAGPARFAAPLLGFELAGVTAPGDDFAARHALYWLMANLAATRPLALIVDDAHWADAASLGALAHLANRLDGLPISLVAAARPEEPTPGLGALRVVARTTIAVPALGTAAAAALIRTLDAEADDEHCTALTLATGGNPFLLTELTRSGAVDASPDRVTDEIGRRLARPADAQALARAAAILGDVPLRLAALLGGVDDPAEHADALVAAGILRGVSPVRFLHPLIRAAVYGRIGPASQGDEHRRAARLLADDHAPAEHVAAQLLRSPPAGDPWVHELLVAAARTAGAFDAQATYLRRALGEQPPPEERTPTLLALAEAEAGSSDFAGAIADLREALQSGMGALEQHAPSMALAGLLAHVGQEDAAIDVLEADIARLTDYPALRATAETALLDIALLTAGTRRRVLPRLTELHRQADARATSGRCW